MIPKETVKVDTKSPMWQSVLSAYKEITSGVPTALTPNNQIEVGFSVVAVGAGAVDGAPLVKPEKMQKNMLAVDITEGSVFYPSAQKFAVVNGGMPGLALVVIKISTFKLKNTPDPTAETAGKAVGGQ